MTTTLSLADFLLARIAEDEGPAATFPAWIRGERVPSRAARECEAKRRIVAMWQEANANREGTSDIELVLDDVLCVLATPYADHPDFREEWKP